MFVKSIKSASVKGYLRLEIDTGEGSEWLLLSEGQYDALGRPSRFDEISDEDFRIARDGDEYNRAKRKALNILAFGDNSERELFAKLSRANISRRCTEIIIAEMKKLGYVDEERQLLRLVECEAKEKRNGPKKIMQRLAAKGYSVEKIKSALRRLEIERELDFDSIKKELVAGISDDEEKRKILYKRGF